MTPHPHPSLHAVVGLLAILSAQPALASWSSIGSLNGILVPSNDPANTSTVVPSYTGSAATVTDWSSYTGGAAGPAPTTAGFSGSFSITLTDPINLLHHNILGLPSPASAAYTNPITVKFDWVSDSNLTVTPLDLSGSGIMSDSSGPLMTRGIPPSSKSSPPTA